MAISHLRPAAIWDFYNVFYQMPQAHLFTVVQVFTFENFNINIHSNSLPVLGFGIPKLFSPLVQFSPIYINLGVLIRRGGSVKPSRLIFKAKAAVIILAQIML